MEVIFVIDLDSIEITIIWWYVVQPNNLLNIIYKCDMPHCMDALFNTVRE